MRAWMQEEGALDDAQQVGGRECHKGGAGDEEMHVNETIRGGGWREV
jgi:hypothetical protein